MQILQKMLEDMCVYGMEAYNRKRDKISTKLLRFTKREKELVVYES